MSFTVVPVHFLSLPAGTRIPFGPDFVVLDIPDWLRNDRGFLENVSLNHRQLFEQSRHALVAEYEAAAIGSPDPDWKGKGPKAIQEVKFQAAMLANLALWLRQPSPVCFSLCFHALVWHGRDGLEEAVIARQTAQHAMLRCNVKDASNPVTPRHVIEAANIYASLRAVPRKSAVFTAIRFFWEALTSYRIDFRYTHFWIGLEALFGPEDSTETTYKLCQRIAFFLGDTPEVTRERFKGAKKCYGLRSKIVHGRWKQDQKIVAAIEETEAIVRTCLRKILDSKEMTGAFVSKRRDEFLEDWVFSRGIDPPAFPK